MRSCIGQIHNVPCACDAQSQCFLLLACLFLTHKRVLIFLCLQRQVAGFARPLACSTRIECLFYKPVALSVCLVTCATATECSGFHNKPTSNAAPKMTQHQTFPSIAHTKSVPVEVHYAKPFPGLSPVSRRAYLTTRYKSILFRRLLCSTSQVTLC